MQTFIMKSLLLLSKRFLPSPAIYFSLCGISRLLPGNLTLCQSKFGGIMHRTIHGLHALFRNNEAVLPHIVLQIWRLAALLPQGSLFVSVYESGSTDETGSRYKPIVTHSLKLN